MLSETLQKLIAIRLYNQEWNELTMPELKEQCSRLRLNTSKNIHYFSARDGKVFYKATNTLSDLLDEGDTNYLIMNGRDVEGMLQEALF